jgi:Asp-tRNA(Asn)/Glu-tRNA(Gln) amidotransferase A subunit family amidase
MGWFRLAGLRPTLGRISRYGVMALSWTQDRLGPMCRYAEDCAMVMQAVRREQKKTYHSLSIYPKQFLHVCPEPVFFTSFI